MGDIWYYVAMLHPAEAPCMHPGLLIALIQDPFSADQPIYFGRGTRCMDDKY